MKSEYSDLRVGLVGVGLDAYWPQFEGLRSRLAGYISEVAGKIAAPNRTIFNLGLVDSHERCLEAAHQVRKEEIDVLLIYVTTYALSSTILPLVQRARIPVILLNLQPQRSIDYMRFNAMSDRAEMTGEWLAYCSACPVPEISNVLRRLDIPFQQVTGTLHGDAACWAEIEGWLTAAGVVHKLEDSRLGLMGHYYSGMLDVATDLVQVSGRFRLYIEMLEVDELTAFSASVELPELENKIRQIRAFFELDPGCSIAEIERAARTAVALDHLVFEHRLDLLAYFYNGSGVSANQDSIASMILGSSLLTGAGIPVAGEYEVKNVIAMKILDLLGCGGSFTEYYALDFSDDVVMMGHDGPGHVAIAEGRIKVRPLQVYHGKVGSGLSVEMSVKHGPVTLLSVVEDKDRGFLFLAAQGESVPGPILEIGNTNSRNRFSLPARHFVESWNSHGPAHHCAVGVGHVASQLQKIATLLGLRCIQVC